MRRQHDGERRRSQGAVIARLSGIIMILPASMTAGWIVGYFLVDRYLHSFPWGSIIITFFGAGAGFYEIVRILAPNRGDDGNCSGRES
ncbi:MAG: AtpZ/AtpI family protein [Acidobacteriia bacterium]|nr:AtpZ/AtpI family protein [Terriglobia bacterium]